MMKVRNASPIKQCLFTLLILIFFGIGLLSCSSITVHNENTDHLSSAPTTLPDYDDWEQSALAEGKYARSDFCPTSFSYQYRSLGLLTVAIGNNISEAAEVDEIFYKIFQQYNQLISSSPAAFQIPITIFVIPDSTIENCVSNNTTVFTSPGRLDAIALTENIIGASTGISEYWVKVGLAYIASGEEVDYQVLKNWYQQTEDLDILGLFIARFMTDWVSQEEVNIARMTAASLVEYCSVNENIPIESVGGEFNNDLRNRWLSSLGVQRSVDYVYDGFYKSFQFSQNEDCSIVAQSEVVYFCLNKLEEQPYFDEVGDAEDLIYRAYTGYQVLTDYLTTNAPSIDHLTIPDGRITIEVTRLDVLLGYTEGNTIRIQNSAVLFDVLHEIVHTYKWNRELLFTNDNLLLAEGFAEYLGKLLPIYEQSIKKAIWEDINGRESNPGISYWYFLDKEQLGTAKEWYLQQGGIMENEDSIDPRLFTDAIAYATMYRNAYGGSMGLPIDEKYERLSPNFNLSEMDGLELNYTQAASYVAWLCDTYSLDAVMAKYVNNDERTALEGKDFEELKLEWMTDLQTKGAGIHIPDSP